MTATGKNPPSITSEERFLVFEVADGDPALIQKIGHIRMISLDAHQVGYTGYMDMLRWLKRNKLTGPTLVGWMKEKHQDSLLRAIAFVRMRVHSDFGIKTIYAKPL